MNELSHQGTAKKAHLKLETLSALVKDLVTLSGILVR